MSEKVFFFDRVHTIITNRAITYSVKFALAKSTVIVVKYTL